MAKKETDKKKSNKDNPIDAAPGSLHEGQVKNTRFSHQAKILYIAFFHSHTRNRLIAASLGILLLIILIGYGQLQINEWTKDFWNAISERNFHEFVVQLGVFFIITSVLLLFNITHTFLNQYLKMTLREGLTDDLINQWMKPKRAFRLTMAGEVGVNPDQRLHEDTRHFAEATADLGTNLLQASVTLIIFIPTLWVATSGFVFKISSFSFSVPGYMIWAVLLYVLIGSFLTWFVARDLVAISAYRFGREADLRAAFMHTNRSIDAVTLMEAEQDEKHYLETHVRNVLDAIWRLVIATTKLTGITAGYGWLSNVAPYIIASPIYFAGTLDLGGLQAAVQAFNQAHQSLRWFVDHYGAIADWRATMLRVTTFRQAILQMDNVDNERASHIKLLYNIRNAIVFNNMRIKTANGTLVLALDKKTTEKTSNFEIEQGKNTLFFGGQDVDKSIFYHAIAGLWPWGKGTIILPKDENIHYIPDQPYIPPTSLRKILLYPVTELKPSDDEIEKSLKIIGLEEYFSLLDTEDIDWQHKLNDVERRLIAFARVILLQPNWIIANQIMDGIDESIRQHISNIIAHNLKTTTFIYISRSHEELKLFKQVIDVKFIPNEDV